MLALIPDLQSFLSLLKGREKVNFVLSSWHSFFFIFRMGNLALLNETLESQQVIYAKLSLYENVRRHSRPELILSLNFQRELIQQNAMLCRLQLR